MELSKADQGNRNNRGYNILHNRDDDGKSI